MTIENLVKVVSPPDLPGETFNRPWGPIEAELGTALPQDYKDFVRLYGNGYFLEFLGINVPRSRNPHTRLESGVRVICDSFLEDEELPYPLWPKPDGLLPFGGTDNGDYLFWLPRGAPENWGIVVWDRGFGDFEAFDCDLTDFLAGLATGEIRPKEFPDDLLPCDHPFSPYSPPPQRVIQVTWRMGSFGSGASGSSRCRLHGGG